MIRVMTLVMLWLAAAQAERAHPVVRPDEPAAAPLVSNAVTVAGTASIEVAADAARLEFVISANGQTAAEALANLKPVREDFKKAIAAVAGLKTETEFDIPRVTRRDERGPGAGRFAATQEAAAHLDYLPKDRQDLDDHLARLTSSIADSGVMAAGVAGPVVIFEVSAPKNVESDLVSEAVKDAEKRSKQISETLKRRLGALRSAYFPATVTVDGKAVPLAEAQIIESNKPTVKIAYTVQMAFALEL